MIINQNIVAVLRAFLKLVSAIFDEIFIFSPNNSPSKTMKFLKISSKKLFSFSRYSIFLFFVFFSTLSRFKFADVIFGITKKPFDINHQTWLDNI